MRQTIHNGSSFSLYFSLRQQNSPKYTNNVQNTVMVRAPIAYLHRICTRS